MKAGLSKSFTWSNLSKKLSTDREAGSDLAPIPSSNSDLSISSTGASSFLAGSSLIAFLSEMSFLSEIISSTFSIF